MGLWICSEDNKVTLWSSSYTGFAEFREEVLARIQNLNQDGILPMVNHPAYEHFFYHSDCDGVWSPEECAAIRDFLREKVYGEALLQDDDFYYENGRLIQLLDGLAYCARMRQNAVFC